MSTPEHTRRAIIVSSMANATLFDVIKEARERRYSAVQRANDDHVRAVNDANVRFFNEVTNAHIQLESSIRTLEADDDDDGYSKDDDGE